MNVSVALWEYPGFKIYYQHNNDTQSKLLSLKARRDKFVDECIFEYPLRFFFQLIEYNISMSNVNRRNSKSQNIGVTYTTSTCGWKSTS